MPDMAEAPAAEEARAEKSRTHQGGPGWLKGAVVVVVGVYVVLFGAVVGVALAHTWPYHRAATAVSFMSDVAAMGAILVGAVVVVFLLDGFTPRVNVRLAPAPRWTEDGALVIGMQVENPSRIRAAEPHALLQWLQYELTDGEELSECVPFTKPTKPMEPKPLGPDDGWHNPVSVLWEGTKLIYPGEVVSVERRVACDVAATVVHVGLQVKLGKDESASHTTTCFAERPRYATDRRAS
jgi:hypothetical protein